MRKVTKPAKVCDKCGSQLTPEKYDEFCDYCKEKITKEIHLQITTFFKGHDNTRNDEFCSWKCVFAWLKNLPYNKERIQFIALPYINSMVKRDFGKDYDAFIDAMKETVKEK